MTKKQEKVEKVDRVMQKKGGALAKSIQTDEFVLEILDKKFHPQNESRIDTTNPTNQFHQ